MNTISYLIVGIPKFGNFFRRLRNVLGHFGTFWNIFGTFLNMFGTFWNILGLFWKVQSPKIANK